MRTAHEPSKNRTGGHRQNRCEGCERPGYNGLCRACQSLAKHFAESRLARPWRVHATGGVLPQLDPTAQARHAALGIDYEPDVLAYCQSEGAAFGYGHELLSLGYTGVYVTHRARPMNRRYVRARAGAAA